jgi:MATE family multidrug resistance protein
MLTYYLTLILLVSYIWGSGLYRETWAGWTWDGLRNWGAFARVALPSLAMTFIFWLCTEIGTFLAGEFEDGGVIDVVHLC